MNTKHKFPNDDSQSQSLPSYNDFHVKETNINILLAQVTTKKPNKPPHQSHHNQQTSQDKTQDKPRVFLITYGESGKDEHNVGRQNRLAAETHKRELEKGNFPDEGHGPRFRPGKDIIKVVDIHNVQDLVKELKVGNVAYLAYFGHSGVMRRGIEDPPGTLAMERHGAGALFIGDDATPGANLTNEKGHTNTGVAAIPKDKFTENAQIRLFGCRAGLGHPPIAQQLADHLDVTVYAYISRGGSLFTKDRELGHGKRKLKKDEHELKIGNVAEGTDLWQVTFGAPVDVNNKNINTDTTWKKFESPTLNKENTQTQNKDEQKSDAKKQDTNTTDAGTPDSPTPDAGTSDAQSSNAVTPDATSPETMSHDAQTSHDETPNDGGMRLGR